MHSYRPTLPASDLSHPQRGGATLLFLLLASLGLFATTASVLYAIRNSQKLQYSEHTSTQAQMRAWAAAQALSQAINSAGQQLIQTNPNLTTSTFSNSLTAGGAVQFAGLPGVSGVYRGLDSTNQFLIFDVTGSSAGASTTLHVAYEPVAKTSTTGNLGNSVTFTGNTTLGGAISYNGTSPIAINVLNGGMTVEGNSTFSNISSLCATTTPTVNGGATSGLPTLTQSNNCATAISFDPNVLKSQANIVFNSDGTFSINPTTQGTSTVSSINGVNYLSYQNAPLSSLPAWVCGGTSGCLSFSSNSGWTINANINAALVLWFGTALTIKDNNGYINSTLISNSPVTVSNHVTVTAFNYLPTDKGGDINPCNATNYPYYPVNLCTNGQVNNTPIGNIAMMAGGDIKLSGGPAFNGAVMATGAIVDTGGGGSPDSIYGPIYTAGYTSTTNTNLGGLSILGIPAGSALGIVPTLTQVIPKNNLIWASPI